MLTMYVIFNTVSGSLFASELYGEKYAKALCNYLNFREDADQYAILPVQLSGELAAQFAYLADYYPVEKILDPLLTSRV